MLGSVDGEGEGAEAGSPCASCTCCHVMHVAVQVRRSDVHSLDEQLAQLELQLQRQLKANHDLMVQLRRYHDASRGKGAPVSISQSRCAVLPPSPHMGCTSITFSCRA
jgi:hypothetical protein